MQAKSTDKARKERLTIYLVKSGMVADGDLLKTENAKAAIDLELEAGEARLYIKKEPPKPSPPWTKLFTTLPNVPDDAFGSTNSVGAVLVYHATGRTFLISFGHGFHLIKTESVERDFGLRVTLNSVAPEKLRSLDKASYDHNPLNFRTQSSKDVDIFDLEMDSETEMLYAVTGTSNVPAFGTHVTGRDALTIQVPTTATGLPHILSTALAKYEQKLPQAFEWFENVNRVRDPDEIDLLDLYLNDALANDPASVWLGEPEIVDWETQIGYSFDLRSRTPRHIVLELVDLQQYLSMKGVGLTVDALKAQPIHINDAEYQSIKSWPAYRCLYAEIVVGKEHFILRNATWYRVRDSFVDTIDQYLSNLPPCSVTLPPYAHAREDEYNLYVAAQDASFHVMDKKNTAIGGRYDKIEFCDLIKDGDTLIHVKCYRSSSTLSHLFAQGNVASEAFVRDEDFRIRLNTKLPKSIQLADPKQRPDASKYKIVYAIATNKTLPAELPFFSKVTLKNAMRTLISLNFRVELAAIQMDPMLSKTAKYKRS